MTNPRLGKPESKCMFVQSNVQNIYLHFESFCLIVLRTDTNHIVIAWLHNWQEKLFLQLELTFSLILGISNFVNFYQ